ncbi:hypothetical protein [Mesorhizobium helmanticense]|uniref:Uncharacterized protein n=1 Tax=Mesorhizobium helmanticense TaxID=1776423 RepID=A0A2T4J196_9HYPH|nr:hypothetical protein [Mesorhizobium helmanticense]PTE11652.1 hypothetical protein C9427_05440 [Mesorhizobium helmanticense]
MGDNLRLTLFVAQRSTMDNSPENIVVARIVGSRADMLQIAAAIVRSCDTARTDASGTEVANAFLEFLEAPKGRH